MLPPLLPPGPPPIPPPGAAASLVGYKVMVLVVVEVSETVVVEDVISAPGPFPPSGGVLFSLGA